MFLHLFRSLLEHSWSIGLPSLYALLNSHPQLVNGTMEAVTILLSRLILRLPFAFIHFNDGEFQGAFFRSDQPGPKATPQGNQVFSAPLRDDVRASM